MIRHFNTAGPNNPADHYSIDSFARINWPEIQQLIDAKKYFVMHAPRQSGKTTLLQAIVDRLNGEGRYETMRFSVQSAQAARDDIAMGNRIIAEQLLLRAQLDRPQSWLASEGPSFVEKVTPGSLLLVLLARWAAHSPKPIVLLIDEIDALVGDTLVSVLGQLRDGYIARPSPSPQSIILCGVRDVRDYRIHTSKGEIITGGSAFNIKTESLRLGNFSEAEVRELYEQHTAATKQVFEESIYSKVMALTGGQPWLVNALARELTEKMPALQDRSRPITLDDVDEAKERLILRRDTHLDQLADKLKEPRVRRVIAPILAGEQWGEAVSTEDRQYVVDLGLITMQHTDGVRIANDIYREVIPRELTSILQSNVSTQVPSTAFVLADGRLDFRGMLAGFQQFYRENSEVWRNRASYEEAAPQLLLQAWLQRVVNGGGRIEREYALGRGRADLFVRFFRQVDGKRAEQRFVVEMKVVRERRSLDATIEEGLTQTARYADKCHADETHLIVVDPSERSWDEKVFVQERRAEGRSITVWGM
ncbi:MAG: AAA-like domain-containing protein [Polyangiaceae bacterium]|nr:AAA-like domain-containing protein [Polyangiaceae bacterium]